MNCDRIAKPYRWLEYMAFGRALENHRFRYLHEIQDRCHALLLGDGDGRFLSKLASSNSTILIDSVDSSIGMLREAHKRIHSGSIPNTSRIRLEHINALQFAPVANSYDVVVTNFFFDCLSTNTVAQLVGQVLQGCCEKALWIVSEFQQPADGWRAWHAWLWLRTMYRFFSVATGLRTRRLPDYAVVLQHAGLQLLASSASHTGLIRSEIWQRT